MNAKQWYQREYMGKQSNIDLCFSLPLLLDRFLSQNSKSHTIMQRQSLGSPVSKLHIHGGSVSKSEDIISVEDQLKRKAQLDSPPPSLVDGQERKQTKPCRFSYSPSKPDRLIHLIPVLILLCFLVLYLCSHRPSRSDLAEFRDFKLPSENIAAAEIGRLVEVRTDDVLAIRKLQETVMRGSKSRYRRKSADF